MNLVRRFRAFIPFSRRADTELELYAYDDSGRRVEYDTAKSRDAQGAMWRVRIGLPDEGDFVLVLDVSEAERLRDHLSAILGPR